MIAPPLKQKTAFLNIGSGKLDTSTLGIPELFQVHVDRSYGFGLASTIVKCEEDFLKFFSENPLEAGHDHFIPMDIFDFVDSFKFKFHHIRACRIFEHMEYTSGQIGRLLEACNCLTVPNATLEIIVPNYLRLSKMMIDLEKEIETYGPGCNQNHLLILNTEFTNSSHVDPHCSVWTPMTATLYINPEQTWDIVKMEDNWVVNGRDIYFKITLQKKVVIQNVVDALAPKREGKVAI